jgi:hypothetical protein
MADTPGRASRQFLLQKDNGEWWTVTYGGPKRVSWERVDPPVEQQTPDEAHRYADSTPADNQRANEWRDFLVELLIKKLDEALEEAWPHIEYWLRTEVVPWVKTTAKSTWNRVTKKRSTHPIQVVTPPQIRITDIAPSSAIALSERTDENAQAHSLNLTPEEAKKQLEDIGHLTRILAARVRALTNAVIREDDEPAERFLERRKQAEQLAVRNVASNIHVMLERSNDLGQAIELLTTYTPVFAAGRVEAASASIERPSQHRDQPPT